MPQPIATQQWTTFLDLEEVVDHLQPGSLDERRRRKLQRYVDAACAQAQNSANRPLAPTTFQERRDGWAGEYIQLRYSPFLQLISIKAFQGSAGMITLVESTPENAIDGVQIDYETSRIMRVFGGYSFPRPFEPGSRNIEITYTAGFNPVPPDIWMATMELVEYWWRNTQETPRTAPLQEVGFDNPAGGGTPGLWPGIPSRVAEVFDYYRIPGIG